MPENVAKEVTNFKGVSLVNVDQLSKITDETLAVRQQEIPFAEEIIETHKEESNHTTTCEKVEKKLEKALEKIIVDPKIKVLKKCRSS